MTKRELDTIHAGKTAITGKQYTRDDGSVYVGTSEKTLRPLDRAKDVPFIPNSEIRSKNVQDAIEEISGDIVTIDTTVTNNFTTTNAVIEENRCLSIALSIVL